jgi:hypothetical protein
MIALIMSGELALCHFSLNSVPISQHRGKRAILGRFGDGSGAIAPYFHADIENQAGLSGRLTEIGLW